MSLRLSSDPHPHAFDHDPALGTTAWEQLRLKATGRCVHCERINAPDG
jgi:hypothetical protein